MLGGGAGLVDEEPDLSLMPLDEILALLACFSAFAPSRSTVGFGPTDVVGFGIGLAVSFKDEGCSTRGRDSFGSDGGLTSGPGCCGGSALFRFVFVPSVHSIVSGAQSSSSSSISAHLPSVAPASSWMRDVMWIPYCCFSSSSVKCFEGGGWAAVRVRVSDRHPPEKKRNSHC